MISPPSLLWPSLCQLTGGRLGVYLPSALDDFPSFTSVAFPISAGWGGMGVGRVGIPTFSTLDDFPSFTSVHLWLSLCQLAWGRWGVYLPSALENVPSFTSVAFTMSAGWGRDGVGRVGVPFFSTLDDFCSFHYVILLGWGQGRGRGVLQHHQHWKMFPPSPLWPSLCQLDGGGMGVGRVGVPTFSTLDDFCSFHYISWLGWGQGRGRGVLQHHQHWMINDSLSFTSVAITTSAC